MNNPTTIKRSKFFKPIFCIIISGYTFFTKNKPQTTFFVFVYGANTITWYGKGIIFILKVLLDVMTIIPVNTIFCSKPYITKLILAYRCNCIGT